MQVAAVRASVARQLCEVFVPPQSMVNVDPPLFHVPTHPVRLIPPWLMAPFMKDPSAAIGVMPLSSFGPVPEVEMVMVHADCWMQTGALPATVPHP